MMCRSAVAVQLDNFVDMKLKADLFSSYIHARERQAEATLAGEVTRLSAAELAALKKDHGL